MGSNPSHSTTNKRVTFLAWRSATTRNLNFSTNCLVAFCQACVSARFSLAELF